MELQVDDRKRINAASYIVYENDISLSDCVD